MPRTVAAYHCAPDLSGVVEQVGASVKGIAVGDEVIGYTDNRASRADYVLLEAANLTRVKHIPLPIERRFQSMRTKASR